jgi:hypothetical protein
VFEMLAKSQRCAGLLAEAPMVERVFASVRLVKITQ